MWSNRNSHLLWVRMQNGTATSEDSLVVSYKMKYALTIESRNCYPWYGINPNEMDIYAHTKACTWMFIIANDLCLKLIQKPGSKQDVLQYREWTKNVLQPDN